MRGEERIQPNDHKEEHMASNGTGHRQSRLLYGPQGSDTESSDMKNLTVWETSPLLRQPGEEANKGRKERGRNGRKEERKTCP